MNRKGYSWNIKQVVGMIRKGSISLENPIQRASGQWKDEDKSLLIDSVLRLFVPDIYALQIEEEIEDKKQKIYDILDGKQRLTILDSYIKDEWELTKLDPITLESTGDTYDISGLKYSQLPEDVQNEIMGYTLKFRVIEIEDGEDEEYIVDQIFYRLNNGKSVSREHLALVAAPKHVQNFVREILNNSSLFKKVAHFPDSSIKKSDREMTVLQAIILASDLPYNSFAAKDVEQFFKENEISQEILQEVSSIFDLIANAYNSEHHKFMTKINIPSFVGFIHNSDNKKDAANFVRGYADTSKKGDAYRKYCGSGNTKKTSVEERVNALKSLYEQSKHLVQSEFKI